MTLPVSNLRPSAGSPQRSELFPAWDLGRFPSADRRYLQSLRSERDPQLLQEALIALAARWENQNRDADALQLYQHLSVSAPADAAGMDRVRQRCQALQGSGPLGLRLEIASRHFVSNATDPAMIFGFMVAGGAAAITRSFTLGSLALRAESLWTRGWRARALAGGAAFGVELPALIGSTRLAHGVLGYPQGFGDLGTLPQEFQGAALFLGALKLSGLGVGALAGRSGAYAPLIRGVASLGGIYLGHRLQEGFGLRQPQDELNRWFDAGETLLQLRIGGRLANAVMGSRNPVMEAALRSRALEVGLREFLPRLPRAASYRYAPLTLAASEWAKEEVTQRLRLDDLRNGPLQADLTQHLGNRATSVVASSVQGIGQETGLGEPWLRLIRTSQYRDLYGFELGLRRLHYATIYSPRLGLTGTYLNWIARLALEQAVGRQDQVRLDRLLRFLGEGGPIGQLEELTAELEPNHRLFSERLFERTRQVGALLLLRSEAHRRIRELPLNKEAGQAFHAYIRLLPNDSDRLYAVKSVGEWLQHHPGDQALIEGVLTRARLNPIGALRVQRMINVVEHEPSNLAKLRELNDADLGGRGRNELIPALHDAEVLAGSQDDGYLNEPELTRELSLFYRRMPEYFEPREIAERQGRTQEILQEVWPSNRVPVDVQHICRALKLFADPASQLLEQDLAAGRFHLVFMARREMSEMRSRLDPLWQGGDFHGLFLPAERDPGGRDTIYLESLGPASSAAYRDQIFNSLSHLIHEHTHFRRAANQINRGFRGTYLEEMLAEALMLRWRAEHGETRLIRHFQEISAGGLGLFLRDWVNYTYFVRQNKDF